MVREELELEAVSSAALEHRGVMGDPDVAHSRDDGEDIHAGIGESSFDVIMNWGTPGRSYLPGNLQVR